MLLEQQVPEFTISLKNKVSASKLFRIRNTADIANVCRMVFSADKIEWVEEFIVFALSRANKVVGFYKVSSGGLAGTVADPRVILQFALLSNATALILAHNHPSGNLQPSEQDKAATDKIQRAAAFLDIRIMDHIIITSEAFYSFHDDGLL